MKSRFNPIQALLSLLRPVAPPINRGFKTRCKWIGGRWVNLSNTYKPNGEREVARRLRHLQKVP